MDHSGCGVQEYQVSGGEVEPWVWVWVLEDTPIDLTVRRVGSKWVFFGRAALSWQSGMRDLILFAVVVFLMSSSSCRSNPRDISAQPRR